MKILFTGGATGGHFYPIIAVADEVNRIAQEQKLLKIDLYYMASKPYDERALFERDIIFKQVPAGKIRAYFSFLNFFDLFKTAIGILKATLFLYSIFPDVIFGKGGFDSFPALFAARIFGIPVIIHESDSIPGKVNRWAAKFARRIAISFPDAAEYFPAEKLAYTGNPVRRDLFHLQREGAHEFLNLEKDVPVIFFLGGSQGARVINEHVLDALPQLVEKYQVIHQTGKSNEKEVKDLASVILEKNPLAGRYKPFGYLNDLALKMSAGAADIIVSRGGSTIFEIALWGVPSIIIPIDEEVSHDQRSNAYAYARSGAAVVIEEKNLSTTVLVSEINRILSNQKERERMQAGAKAFTKPDAATVIAQELIAIALEHEK